MNARRTLIKVHLWLGLSIGLLWVVQGVTGAALVFFRDLDRMALPAASGGPMAEVDELVAAAALASGGARIVRLAVADPRRDLVHAYYATPRPDELGMLVLDASTTQVLARREDEPRTPFAGSAWRWVFLLHMTLTAGTAGEIFIGATGLLLASTVLLGLWIAWPPRRGWKAAFDYRRWRRPQHKLYGWHRAVGLAAGVLLFALALTGAYMNFDHWLNPALARWTTYHGMYHAHPVDRLPRQILAARDALAIAEARFPEATWVRLYLPTPDEPVYRVQLHQPGELRAWIGKTAVYIDPVGGAIVDLYDALDAPLINRVLDAAFPLHNGEIAGLGGRMLAVLCGIVLPGMFVTGLLSWLSRRRRRVTAGIVARSPSASRPH